MEDRQLGESPPWRPYKLKPGYSRRPRAHLEWRVPLAELFLLEEAMPGAFHYLKGDFFLIMTGWMTALHFPSREKGIQKT